VIILIILSEKINPLTRAYWLDKNIFARVFCKILWFHYKTKELVKQCLKIQAILFCNNFNIIPIYYKYIWELCTSS
jgi:hypothetical protein